MRIVNYRCNHAVIHGNRNPHVDAIVQANPLGAPTRIQAWMLEQHTSC